MVKLTAQSQKEIKYKVKVTLNGPYVISGGVPLKEQKMLLDADGQCHGWEQGKIFPAQETYALCRCGHSQNRPFCDGPHAKIIFDGTETASHKT